ncbi:YidB family protein [Methylobacterium radiodurans]|uniref:YidB family protein n=1 Tax=Methylobacterium radiodurans TaxID=2202828 RepID=UPI001FE8E932
MGVLGSVTTIFGGLGARLERALDAKGADGLALAAAKFFPGGLPALLDALRAEGHGAAVESWLGRGPNAAVPAEAFARVLPPAVAAAFAHDLGLRPERVPVTLAQFLPAAVDVESPDGTLRPQPQFSTQAMPGEPGTTEATRAAKMAAE